MLDFLDKIRAKPEGTRKVILFSTVGTLSFLISLVWLSTLNARLNEGDEAEIAYEETTPTEAISQTASAFWGDITESFGKGKEAFGTIAEEGKEAEAGMNASSTSGSISEEESESLRNASSSQGGVNPAGNASSSAPVLVENL